MKTRTFAFITICVITMLFSAKIKAYYFEQDGIYYNIVSVSDKTCEVTYKDTDYNSYSGDITIPSTVTYNTQNVTVVGIGNNAFKNCRNLTSISLPNSLKSIGVSAFYDCRLLKELKIPKSVTTISGAFYQLCINLEKIIFEEGSIFKLDNFTVVDTTTGTIVAGNKKSTIPTSGASIIGREAFIDSELFKLLTIPANINKIEDRAFEACRYLTDLKIEDSDSVLTLSYCINKTSIKNVYIGRNFKTSIYPYTFAKVEYVILGPKVNKIHYENFRGCNFLKSIQIGGTITEVENYAFYQCWALEDLDFTKIQPEYIESSMFYQCRSLKLIRFAEGAAINSFSIQTNATMYISESLKLKSEKSFSGCIVDTLIIEDSDKNLALHDIHFKHLYVGRNTTLTYTNGTNTVRSIEFGDKTKTFESDFSKCVYMDSLIFGRNFSSMSPSSFKGCKNIYKIISKNPTPPLNANFDDNVYLNAVVKVPKGSLNAYKEDLHWSKFWNISEMEESSGINNIDNDKTAIVDIYNLQGTLIKKGVLSSEATNGLPKGLYIIGGKKTLVK